MGCPTSKNSKSIFKPIRKFSRLCVNTDFYISSELHLSQFSARSENLLREAKSPIFGTKVDFFPLSGQKMQNVRNFNKFISPKLYLKKKNRSNIFDDENPQFSGQKW